MQNAGTRIARRACSAERPTGDHFDIYTNRDGTTVYYRRTLKDLMKYEYLFGLKNGHWSHTNHEADETF